MTDVILTGKIPSENTRRSQAFYGIFPVEMEVQISQYRDTKATSYLFFKITKVFPEFVMTSSMSLNSNTK